MFFNKLKDVLEHLDEKENANGTKKAAQGIYDIFSRFLFYKVAQ